MFDDKTKALNKLIDRLDIGLSTLKKTADDVAELQVDLDHTMVKVDEKRKSTEALLENMGKQRAEAEVFQDSARNEAEKAGVASAEAQAIEDARQNEVARRAAENQAAGTGGYQAGYGSDFMDGGGRGTGMGAADKGGSDSMGSFATGGRVGYFYGGLASIL